MSDGDTGGDPPCWAYLLDQEDAATTTSGDRGALVVDLGAESAGSGGAVWSLPHGGDLDANLVRLDPGVRIDAHVNNDLDVLVFVQSGIADLTVDGLTQRLAPDHLALIAKGSQRSIVAGAIGVTYLSVHRRRSPLGITRRAPAGTRRETEQWAHEREPQRQSRDSEQQ